MSRDHEMTRYFEYMRPRYTNPTYASSNVGSTLGLISSSSYSKPLLRLADTNPYREQEPAPKQGSTEQFIGENISTVKEPSEGKSSRGHKRARSLMSNYGTSSLGQLPRVLNERDIYEKQEKKYNIITIQPKEYQETIKKYPKYHLENQDQNYYRKLQLQDEYARIQEARPKLAQNPEHPMPLPSRPQQDRSQTFRPKMLNNIDELGGVL